MDVLVNATTLVVGGGIQVAASFIIEAESASADIDWHYAVSPQVAEELASLGVIPKNLTLFPDSPARDKSQRQRLVMLEKSLQPDVVFTIFGPAYVKFAAPHLCGVAVGWVTHSTRLAYSTVPGWMNRLRIVLASIYKGWWLRRADGWVVEAENARAGMLKRLGIPSSKVAIVPNSCAAVFNQAHLPPASRPQSADKLSLIYVSAYYPHKHIEFVPEVAAALSKVAPDRDFEFVLTLPEDAESTARILQNAEKLGVSKHIRNAGRVSLNGVIELYRNAQICFMPSLLETFSATYPEAMALGRPIVTTDLDFAHVVCQDAAEYYPATDADAAVRAILRLLNSEETWQSRIRAGTRVLEGLPTAQRKYELYVDAIRATAQTR
jgi:glycosyltransferase involved in cell wall biosynthesis